MHALIRRTTGRLGIHAQRPAGTEALQGADTASSRWTRFLWRIRHSIFFPLVVGLLAAISSATGLYPFGPVLAAAILVALGRWWSLYWASCLGALCGVLALTVLLGKLVKYGVYGAVVLAVLRAPRERDEPQARMPR